MESLEKFYGTVRDFFVQLYEAFEANITLDWKFLIIAFLIILVLFASGAFASSIAEARGHNPKTFFFAGFFIPIIMPIGLLFQLKVKPKPLSEIEHEEEPGRFTESYRKKHAQEMMSEEEIQMEEQALAQEIREKAEAMEISGIPDQKTFTKMVSLPASDMPRWIIRFSGYNFNTMNIVEAGEKFVSVEFLTDENETSKIRIPYEKIESFQALEQPEEELEITEMEDDTEQ